MMIIILSSFFFALAIGLILTEKMENLMELFLLLFSFCFFMHGTHSNFRLFVLLFMIFRSLFSNVLNLFINGLSNLIKGDEVE